MSVSASILATKAIISPSVKLFANDTNLLQQNVASLQSGLFTDTTACEYDSETGGLAIGLGSAQKF